MCARQEMAFVGVIALALSLGTMAPGQTYYGEPVVLKGRAIYFTSWKYVRPGQFAWRIERDPADQNVGAWLKGDGTRPARFETLDMPRGIRLVAQPATKVPFQPGQLAATLHDPVDHKYKAWYTVPPCPGPEPFSSKDRILSGHDAHVAYAESADGVTWERPRLGLFEYNGSRDNNIVLRNDLNGSTRGYHGGCVFLDPTSKYERFKMLHLGIVTEAEWAAFGKLYPDEVDTMARRRDVGGYRCVFAVFGAVSPDGLHWTNLPEPFMIQHADTLNSCAFDLDRKEYVATVRAWQVNARAPVTGSEVSDSWIGVGRRSIGRAVSRDFRHFSKAELLVTTEADMAPSHVWYTNARTTLPDAPDNHVMFPLLWEMEKDAGSVWLLSSADGWTWSRVPGGPVVTPGQPGERDGAFLTCSGNLLEYPGQRWGIAYEGTPIPHKYPGRELAQRQGLYPGVEGVSGLATWPRGRLVALQADDEGEFATVAIVPPGDRIRLNASVLPTGHIQVGVRRLGQPDDIPGRTFAECDRIIGDHLGRDVTWKGNPALNHDGKPVVLCFHLKQAKLFAVEFP